MTVEFLAVQCEEFTNEDLMELEAQRNDEERQEKEEVTEELEGFTMQQMARRVHAKSLQSCLTLCNLWTVATSLLCPWDFPGKNTGVGCHALFQGIFLTQGSSLHLIRLLHWQAGSLPPCHLGSPTWQAAFVSLRRHC